jgi:hypothetical protein
MLVPVWARALFLVGLVVVTPTLHVRSEQILPLPYNQGLARVDGGWLLSGTRSPLPDTDVLVRTDDDLKVVVEVDKAIPEAYRSEGYNHVGDGDVVDGIYYVPFEQPDYDLGHQVTARYDATTLAFIDAVELPQHENSFLTVDPDTMTAYTMDHFDGDTLLRYDVDNGWQPLPPLKLPMLLHSTQGADVADGAVWISTSDPHNDVYRVDIATGATTLAGSLGHEGAEGEGLDATPIPAGRLHAMVNDLRQQRVELDHYDLLDETRPATKSSDTSWGILAVAGVIFGVGIGLAIGLWRLRRASS